MVIVDLDDLIVTGNEGLFSYRGTPFTGAAESWDDGKLTVHIEYLEGIWHGVERWWNSAGRLVEEKTHCCANPHGFCREWHPNGQLSSERLFEHGIWIYCKYWDENGNLRRSDDHAFTEEELAMLRGIRLRREAQGFGPPPDADSRLLPS